VVDTGKAVCNKCKEDAFFFNGKWWCAAVTDIGDYNLKGTCRNDVSRNSK
jgi:hypothetical protein